LLLASESASLLAFLSAWQQSIRKTLLASYLFENQEASTTRREIHCDLPPYNLTGLTTNNLSENR